MEKQREIIKDLKPVKIAIVGSRSFSDYEALSSYIQSKCEELYIIPCMIISGGAKGTDLLAQRYAQEHNIPINVFSPDWKQFGRAAGIIRNRDIIESCDICFAFWDGASRGTKHDIDYCARVNKPCYVSTNLNPNKYQ